jgi:hypothetical protein
VQVGREESRQVETPRRQVLPGFAGQDGQIDFLLPEDFQRLALGVIIKAGEPDKRRVHCRGRQHYFLNEVLPLADADDLARFGGSGNFLHTTVRESHVAGAGRSPVQELCSPFLPAPWSQSTRWLRAGGETAD